MLGEAEDIMTVDANGAYMCDGFSVGWSAKQGVRCEQGEVVRRTLGIAQKRLTDPIPAVEDEKRTTKTDLDRKQIKIAGVHN